MAKRLDLREVLEILDYRNAKAAIALFNQGRKGMDALLKQPPLQEILLRLTRAQNGHQVEMGDVLQVMREREVDEDEG